MAKPVQSALCEQRLHGGESSTGSNMEVVHFVIPTDAKDVVKTLHVEIIQLLLLLGIGCPGFTPAQECSAWGSPRHEWSVVLGLLYPFQCIC